MFVFKLKYKSMRKKVMAKNTFSVKNDMQYLFKPKVSLSKIERKKKRRAWAFAIGSVLVLIQLVLTVLFLLKMFKLDILPFKYLFMINIILILLVLYDFTSQFTKSHILGKLISVMLSCLILFTYLFAAKFDSVLDKLGAANVEIDIVDVCVLSNDKAQNLPLIQLQAMPISIPPLKALVQKPARQSSQLNILTGLILLMHFMIIKMFRLSLSITL